LQDSSENKNIIAKEIVTGITINARPEKVWSILTDFSRYPEWNPFIKSITGIAEPGRTITARIEPPGSAGMTFKPVVLTFEPNREFRWLGHLLVKGLFDGEHSFELTENPDGTTRFVQREKFTGILVPLFQKQLDRNTKSGFELMNGKLKELSESRELSY
jgi:hypothetical protein